MPMALAVAFDWDPTQGSDRKPARRVPGRLLAQTPGLQSLLTEAAALRSLKSVMVDSLRR